MPEQKPSTHAHQKSQEIKNFKNPGTPLYIKFHVELSKIPENEMPNPQSQYQSNFPKIQKIGVVKSSNANKSQTMSKKRGAK